MFPISIVIARLRSPSGQILLGRGLQFIAQLALVLLVPRLLSQDDFVKYNLATPLGYLIGSIACGWINAALCRFTHDFLSIGAESKREAAATYFFLVGLLASGIFAVLQCLFHSQYAFAALIVFSSSVRAVVIGVLNASYRPAAFLKVNLLYLLPTATFLVVCGAKLTADFETAMLIYIALESMIGILVVVRARIIFWRPLTCDYSVLHPYLLFGGPLVLNGVAYWVLSLSDRYFLSIWASVSDTANYILSYQLAGSIVQYPMSFYQSVFNPKALHIEQSLGREAAVRYAYTELRRYLAITPIIFVVCVAIVVGFKSLFYPGYRVDFLIVATIVAAHLIHATGHFYNKDYELTGRTIVTTSAVFAGAVANVLSNLALIPVMGALGAAVATLVGYVAYLLVLFRARPRRQGQSV